MQIQTTLNICTAPDHSSPPVSVSSLCPFPLALSLSLSLFSFSLSLALSRSLSLRRAARPAVPESPAGVLGRRGGRFSCGAALGTSSEVGAALQRRRWRPRAMPPPPGPCVFYALVGGGTCPLSRPAISGPISSDRATEDGSPAALPVRPPPVRRSYRTGR